jgi:hypothetical protein
MVALAIMLFGCNSSNGGNGTLGSKVQQLVSIDQSSTVPVVNGNNTQGVLYIHNYSDSVATDISFDLDVKQSFSQMLKYSVKHLLNLFGLMKPNSLINQDGFQLVNLEQCKSIPANGSCSISFVTPGLSVGNSGSSMIRLAYKLNGKNLSTNQLINYSYYNTLDHVGVNFNGSLTVVAAPGTDAHIVGYLVGGGDAGTIYNNVQIANNNQQIFSIAAGFTQNLQIAAGQVVPVDFKINVQGSGRIGLIATPSWNNNLVKSKQKQVKSPLTHVQKASNIKI